MIEVTLHDVKMLMTRPAEIKNEILEPALADLLYPNRLVILKEVATHRAIDLWIDVTRARTMIDSLRSGGTGQMDNFEVAKALFPLGELTLQQITITENAETTRYQSTISIKNRTGLSEIVCRPSDALNLAITLDAPIYIDDWLLDKRGFVPDEEGNYTWKLFCQNKPWFADKQHWSWYSVLDLRVDQLAQAYVERGETASLGFQALEPTSEFVMRYLFGLDIQRGNMDYL